MSTLSIAKSRNPKSAAPKKGSAKSNATSRRKVTLAANRQERALAVGAEAPSPLAGLIVDADGSRMTPTHALLEGRQPIELTPTRLLRLSKDLPHDWSEQRHVLDFAA